jgi:hypothetical protein
MGSHHDQIHFEKYEPIKSEGEKGRPKRKSKPWVNLPKAVKPCFLNRPFGEMNKKQANTNRQN